MSEKKYKFFYIVENERYPFSSRYIFENYEDAIIYIYDYVKSLADKEENDLQDFSITPYRIKLDRLKDNY